MALTDKLIEEKSSLKIKELSGDLRKKDNEIIQLKKELKKNEDALKKLLSSRNKENDYINIKSSNGKEWNKLWRD